jgi:hypothetical protein
MIATAISVDRDERPKPAFPIRWRDGPAAR